MSKELSVHVLFRFSQKTGKVDTTMTSLGKAMLEMWALNNTTKTKGCIIADRDTGDVVFTTQGTGDFPRVRKGNLGNIENFGISMIDLQNITDDRFDN